MNERPDRQASDVAREYDDVRRTYGELGDEPIPPALDARVLDAARAAVRPRHTRARWIVPVSLAATVVLAVGVALDVGREARRGASGEVGVEAPQRAVTVPAAAPVPPVPVIEDAVDEPFVADAPRPAPPSRANEAAAAPARDAAAERAATSAPADAHGAAARKGQALERNSAPAAPSAPAAAPAAASASAPAASAAAAPVVGTPSRSPEEWLAAIEELRRAGRAAEADAELAKFRAAYPDYPLR